MDETQVGGLCGCEGTSHHSLLSLTCLGFLCVNFTLSLFYPFILKTCHFVCMQDCTM
jgi:hypothetical protein